MTAFRCSEEELRRIDEFAASYGMSRTSYLIAAALGNLPEHEDQLLNRIEALEQRLERLEARLDDR